MADYLPVVRDTDKRSPTILARAASAQSKTELAIYEYGLHARFAAECDRLDSEAASDAVRAALDEELSLLDEGMAKASGSAAKAELVSRKVSILAAINDRRINRRFGG